MILSNIELTDTGIALIGADESRVELCGSDVWDLLSWLNWHIIDLVQRQEMGKEPLAAPSVSEESPKEQS